jgi:hypothetical protein
VPDPVSWKVIEPGWRVVSADGADVGRVDEVAGDGDKDIFNGLSVSRGLFRRRRYVPSEQVAEIVEGTVRLRIDRSGFEHLGDYRRPPPSEQFLPE